MKVWAISLWQPWASLVICGAKLVETRSWWPKHLDLPAILAIHATKGTGTLDMDEFIELCTDPYYKEALQAAGHASPSDLPRGMILGLVRLANCVNTVSLMAGHAYPGLLTRQEQAFGDYTPGRYGWVFDQVLRYEVPEPARGKQSLWEYEVPPCHVEWVRKHGGMFDFVE
jgi:activating signal cointegrator 1